jgi:hypothetical protein
MYTFRVFLDCAVRGGRDIGLARYMNIFKEYSVRVILYGTKHVQIVHYSSIFWLKWIQFVPSHIKMFNKYIYCIVLHNTVTLLLGFYFGPNIQASSDLHKCLELSEITVQKSLY